MRWSHSACLNRVALQRKPRQMLLGDGHNINPLVSSGELEGYTQSEVAADNFNRSFGWDEKLPNATRFILWNCIADLFSDLSLDRNCSFAHASEAEESAASLAYLQRSGVVELTAAVAVTDLHSVIHVRPQGLECRRVVPSFGKHRSRIRS